ncbi:MAG: sensor histidine kinase [Methyloligellaceae bacterium]
MRLELSRLVLVKRYLWGSLIVAIAPLVLLAVLYDRYTSDLLSTLLTKKVLGELEAVSVKMTGFLNARAKRLDNLVDLPDVTEALSVRQGKPLPTKLMDLLLLEAGDPDIYNIEFFDHTGQCIRAVPTPSKEDMVKDYSALPTLKIGNLEILGPVIPDDGRPGWFLIRKPITRNGRKIGALAFRTRLASFTELASSVSRRGVYEPNIRIDDKTYLSVVGTKVQMREPLRSLQEKTTGWQISLVRHGPDIQNPRDQIRYLLLIVAIFSGLGVVYLFVHMSERLARMINPLNEGAKAIARGDFSVKVSEKAPGELRTLAQSFNEMTSHLNSLISSRVDMERRAALGNFAAGIAHEVRNPLTTIRTSIHGLKRLDNDPYRQEIFQVMIDEIVRVDGIVTEFLEYARPREPRKEVIPVNYIFRSMEALISATLQEANIKLVKTGDMSILLDVDPGQLRQVIMNIVLNAIEAMPEGGYLTIRSQCIGDFAEINIQDTGQGIDEENLSKALVPFFTTKGKGTGLGLSICNQLVTANGGTLEIDSVVGQGTSVSIRIPVVREGGVDV